MTADAIFMDRPICHVGIPCAPTTAATTFVFPVSRPDRTLTELTERRFAAFTIKK